MISCPCRRGSGAGGRSWRRGRTPGRQFGVTETRSSSGVSRSCWHDLSRWCSSQSAGFSEEIKGIFLKKSWKKTICILFFPQWRFYPYVRENSVTERFNSRFLRDHQVARPIDLYNKIHWAIFSLPRYLARVGPLYYSILSAYTKHILKLSYPIQVIQSGNL